jgi:sortase A
MRLGIRGQGIAVAMGVVLVVAGTAAIIRPFLDVGQRNAADTLALQAWKAGGDLNLKGALGPSAHFNAGTDASVACNGAAAAPDAYAMVAFPSLPAYGYAGVAIDADWSGLLKRSMVHWHGSPSPGEAGNMIVAFHREPDYQYIDRLGPGDVVTVQDRSCHTYGYRVATRSDLSTKEVPPLLGPTQGHDLTLVTCTPFWQDYNRLVWRATLVTKDGVPV